MEKGKLEKENKEGEKIKNRKLGAVVEASLMVTLSIVLSNFVLFKMPFGGSVTLGSGCPIILLSFRRKAKLAVVAGAVYGFIQILLSFHAPPVKDLFSFASVILLDYLIPFSVLGLADIFYNKIHRNKAFFSAIAVSLIRFFSAVLSGVIVWKSVFPENFNVWTYSVLYNSSYMIPEIMITSILCAILCKNKNFFLKFLS